MNATPSASHALSDYIDLVDRAVATLSRRLPPGVSREDLASVGKLALISTLHLAQGAPDEVRAYSYVRVRGAMLDELRRLDPLSRGRRDQLTAVLRAQAELSGRFGRLPTRAEIALATELSIAEVASAQALIAQQSHTVEPELETLPDTEAPSPAEAVEFDDLRMSLRSALSRLASTQAAVLYRYYFDGATLDAIAEELGVSKERVRQIREAGEKKLRADFIVLAIWQTLLDRESTS